MATLWQMGVDPFAFPFLDSHGVLSTAECHRYGIDVLVFNPCDVLGRTLDYSPFWLLTAKLGLHTGLTQAVGLTLDLLFLFWVYFLPPARDWGQMAVLTLALLSSSVGFALERANLDLAIFIIAIIAANWATRGMIWRLFSYLLIMLGALVKYYPGILLILAIRERLHLLVSLAAATIAVTILFVVTEWTDLFRALAQIENGTWFSLAFGAQNLPRGFVEVVAPAFTRSPPPPIAIELVGVFIVSIAATAIARTEDLQICFDRMPERQRVMMLVGCALIVACFFTAQNGLYRGIYFLFVVPGIAGLCAMSIGQATRPRFILALVCVLFLMWSQFFYRSMTESLNFLQVDPLAVGRAKLAFWLLREIIWWWIVTILLAFLLCLIYRSQSGQQMLRLFLRSEYPPGAPARLSRRAMQLRDEFGAYSAAFAVPFGSANSPAGRLAK